jgi:hypothetical protein
VGGTRETPEERAQPRPGRRGQAGEGASGQAAAAPQSLGHAVQSCWAGDGPVSGVGAEARQAQVEDAIQEGRGLNWSGSEAVPEKSGSGQAGAGASQGRPQQEDELDQELEQESKAETVRDVSGIVLQMPSLWTQADGGVGASGAEQLALALEALSDIQHDVNLLGAADTVRMDDRELLAPTIWESEEFGAEEAVNE